MERPGLFSKPGRQLICSLYIDVNIHAFDQLVRPSGSWRPTKKLLIPSFSALLALRLLLSRFVWFHQSQQTVWSAKAKTPVCFISAASFRSRLSACSMSDLTVLAALPVPVSVVCQKKVPVWKANP